ncbi:MAG: hypothetical protein WCJ29_01360 [bacterium]
MAFIVETWDETVQNPRETPIKSHRRCFDCHYNVWNELLRLGRENGWKSAGTLPGRSSWDEWARVGRYENDYDPIDYKYTKSIFADDAKNWADALERMLIELPGDIESSAKTKMPILLVEGMTEGGFVSANRGISVELIKEFIIFLRGGGFGFTFDN